MYTFQSRTYSLNINHEHRRKEVRLLTIQTQLRIPKTIISPSKNRYCCWVCFFLMFYFGGRYVSFLFYPLSFYSFIFISYLLHEMQNLKKNFPKKLPKQLTRINYAGLLKFIRFPVTLIKVSLKNLTL